MNAGQSQSHHAASTGTTRADPARDVLVTTAWVAQRLNDPKVRLVEVDVDTKAFDAGHIPGAVALNWQTQLQDQVRRDVVSREGFEQLMSDAGVTPDDTVVLYGDNNNWFAAYAFWLFKLYGHRDVRLLDGGRSKWLSEDDKPLTRESRGARDGAPRTPYRASDPDPALRAMLTDVLAIARSGSHNLVDVRSPDEFSGKVVAPPGMTETAQRGGHVPGARNVPWSQTVKPDGTFKDLPELRRLYLEHAGLNADKPTVTYCRIGERSSHSWFVLKYLLGLPDVRNYDGSWTEYGSVIGAPIEKSV